MKKLLSLAVIMLFCCSAFLMLGCSVNNGSMTITVTNSAFSITQAVIDDEEAYIDAVDAALKTITIEVKDEDGVVLYTGNLSEAKKNGAAVTGFSLKYEGTDKVAYVTMYGVKQSFNYSVTKGTATPPPAEQGGNSGGEAL